MRGVGRRHEAEGRDGELDARRAALLAGLGGVLWLGRRHVGKVGRAPAGVIVGVALGAADGGVHDPVPAAGVVGVDLGAEPAVLLVDVDGDADGKGFAKGEGDGWVGGGSRGGERVGEYGGTRWGEEGGEGGGHLWCCRVGVGKVAVVVGGVVKVDRC